MSWADNVLIRRLIFWPPFNSDLTVPAWQLTVFKAAHICSQLDLCCVSSSWKQLHAFVRRCVLYLWCAGSLTSLETTDFCHRGQIWSVEFYFHIHSSCYYCFSFAHTAGKQSKPWLQWWLCILICGLGDWLLGVSSSGWSRNCSGTWTWTSLWC